MAEPPPHSHDAAGIAGSNSSSQSHPRRGTRKVRWRKPRHIWVLLPALAPVILLVIAWLAGRPSGALDVHLSSEISSHSDKANLARKIFDKADEEITLAEGYYRTLSFLEPQAEYGAAVPKTAGKVINGIHRFIDEFTLEVVVDNSEQPFHISLALNLVELLRKTYEWVGLADYYIVFRQIESISCSNPEQDECWEVQVQYWPSNLRPETLKGTKESIAGDLALLVLRGVLRVRDDAWRRDAGKGAETPFLMESATPTKMHELEATSKGILILREGFQNPECDPEAPLACIDAVRGYLGRATSIRGREEEYSPVGAYGLAMIEIDAAVRAARRGDPALTVLTHLREAEAWTKRANSSDFLLPKLEGRQQSGFSAQFLELSEMEANDQFLDLVRDFSCMLAEQWTRDWKNCMEHVRTLDWVPEPLGVYVDGARLEAQYEAGSDLSSRVEQSDMDVNSEAASIVSYSGGLEAVERSFRRDLIVLKEMCKQAARRGTNIELVQLAEAMADRVPQGNRGALMEVYMHASGCGSYQGFPSAEQLREAKDYVESVENDLERARLRLGLYEYYIRIEDLQGALHASMGALHLPWAKEYLSKSLGFERVMEKQEYKDQFRDKVASTNTVGGHLLECHKGQKWGTAP